MRAKKNILFIFLLLISFSGFAMIYRSIDSQGNPHYSDTQLSGSTSIVLSTINSYSVTTNTKPGEQANNVAAYNKLAITAPFNQQTIQNQHDISINISVQPDLKKDDSLELWLDGNPYERHTSTQFIVTNIDRGEHSVQTKILSSDGKVLMSSATVAFFVHLTSKL